MHGCPHNPARVVIPSLVQCQVTQSNLGLASIPQDINDVGIGYDRGIFRRRAALNRNLLTLGIVGYFGHGRLIIDQNRQSQPPSARQLKGIALIPR